MKRAKPLVVYWNNQPTPYVVDRLNAVAARGNVDLEAWFDNYREPDRSWDVHPEEWSFRARVLGTTDDQRPTGRVPIELIRRVRPDLLIANYDRKHMGLGLLAARGLASRTAIRCLPTWPAWTTPSRRQDLARHLLFRSVDLAKVPGPDGADYAVRFGLTSDRVCEVTQSVDVAHYAAAAAMSTELREQRRAQLGVSGCTFVYVGRIWGGKGVDHLIRAFALLREECPETTLLIVGDGPDEAEFRRMSDGIPGVVWHGFVQPRDVPDIYAAADVLVFPTLGDPNGLVVEEAMAAGLPVISTSAAGDIRQRIPQGVAGLIVPPADHVALAAAMGRLATNAAERREMGAVGRRLASTATAEHYAQDFETFVEVALATPSRRTVTAIGVRVVAPLIRLVLNLRAKSAADGQGLTRTNWNAHG